MTTTEPVSLYSLIHQVLDETTLDDPREIAAQVADRIPDHLAREYLVNALAADVRSAMGARRNQALSNVAPPAVIQPPARPRTAPAPPRVGGSIQAEQQHPRPGRSAKREGIRDWWAQALASRIYIGDDGWKTLGQCGAKELEYAEMTRRKKAEGEIRYARMYFGLRQLLEKFDVATVAELPENAARQVMSS